MVKAQEEIERAAGSTPARSHETHCCALKRGTYLRVLHGDFSVIS